MFNCRRNLRFSLIAARAHGITTVAALSLVSALIITTWADVSIEFPLGVKRLPLALCLPILLALFHGYALLDPWSTFSSSAVRYGFWFRLRLSAFVITVSSLATLPLAVASATLPIVTNTATLLAVTQVAVAVVGEHYWLPASVVGFLILSLYMSSASMAQTITSWYDRDEVKILGGVALLVAALGYSILGPRRGGYSGDEV
jgi:hypothetical protein